MCRQVHTLYTYIAFCHLNKNRSPGDMHAGTVHEFMITVNRHQYIPQS